jgi:hypothetical protein
MNVINCYLDIGYRIGRAPLASDSNMSPGFTLNFTQFEA